MQFSPRLPRLVMSVFLAASPFLTGCGISGSSPVAPTPVVPAVRISGSVHGGQQPVSGANIFLYAAGKAARGSASRSMLTGTVTTNASGGFSIPDPITCQAGDQVYIVAVGGDSGSGVNTAIALMTALGSCATLAGNASTTFIAINEVTTAVSVAALVPYMLDFQHIGSSSDTASSNALAAAFASVNLQVNTATGSTQSGSGVPVATINSLADSVGACVNSSQGGTACASLFSATTFSGPAPTDTVAALLNLALYPTQTSTAAVYALGIAQAPFQPTLTTPPMTFSLHPSDVLTHHNDNTRQGLQAYETILTPANVKSTSFGKKFAVTVDSYLFAQPLYIGAIGMPDGAVHNVLIAASTHATVYAFDADTGGALWTQSFIPAGERYTLAADYNGCNNPPEAGIVGTPVIDRPSQTIYFVTKTIGTSTGVTLQRIHAISLLDGAERTNSPQVIAPVFSGSGNGAASGKIAFAAQHQVNRAAMTLAVDPTTGLKTVYAAFASSCDIGPYHGVIVGYNATNVASTVALYNDTPNGGDGGIWLGAGGLAVDPRGSVYALVGNGTFDGNTGGPDFGDSAVKLLPPAVGGSSPAMTVSDYFTPSNEAQLEQHDLDIGGNAGILFTDSGSNRQLLVASDKNGYIYLLDTSNMGGFDTGANGINSLNGDVQDFQAQGNVVYDFAFFNNTLYSSTPLRAYTFVPGSGSTPGRFNPTASASTNVSQTAPIVSANGNANPIVWAQDTGGTLHAYSAALTEIYNTSQAMGSRDAPPQFVKFTSPIIANGKVYLSGHGSLVVYGLLP